MNLTLSHIKELGGIAYVATPYSKYREGIDAAYMAACRVTGQLLVMGVHAYSPIAHSHGVALHGGIDPYDHSIWLPACLPMMEAATCCIVAKLQGWDTSYGVTFERNWFHDANRPVFFYDPATGIFEYARRDNDGQSYA